MKKYNLGFISDEVIFAHVKNTVNQYRRSINLKEFNKNLIDPIKLTFDSKIYDQTIRQIIESECIRQIDKSNNNCIGYFHQYIFKHVGNGWEVPPNGEKDAFFKLCQKLPDILDDVIAEDETAKLHIAVYDELDKANFYKSLYLLAFKTYEGFERF